MNFNKINNNYNSKLNYLIITQNNKNKLFFNLNKNINNKK